MWVKMCAADAKVFSFHLYEIILAKIHFAVMEVMFFLPCFSLSSPFNTWGLQYKMCRVVVCVVTLNNNKLLLLANERGRFFFSRLNSRTLRFLASEVVHHLHT